jgi:hypothetical protein
MFVFISGKCQKNLANLSNQFAARANDRFEFQKCSQLFIRPHSESLSVTAMRINNPDRSPFFLTPEVCSP